MPMLGVIRLILDREEGSASGEDDFFSVARTIPFVAGEGEGVSGVGLVWLDGGLGGRRGGGRTLDAEGCYALVDGVEGIFWVGLLDGGVR